MDVALNLRAGKTIRRDYFLVGEYLSFNSGFGRVSVWLIRLFCCCFFFEEKMLKKITQIFAVGWALPTVPFLVGIALVLMIMVIYPQPAAAQVYIGQDADGITWSATKDFAERHMVTRFPDTVRARSNLAQRRYCARHCDNNDCDNSDHINWRFCRVNQVNTVVSKEQIAREIRHRVFGHNQNEVMFDTINIVSVWLVGRNPMPHCKDAGSVTILGQFNANAGTFILNHLEAHGGEDYRPCPNLE